MPQEPRPERSLQNYYLGKLRAIGCQPVHDLVIVGISYHTEWLLALVLPSSSFKCQLNVLEDDAYGLFLLHISFCLELLSLKKALSDQVPSEELLDELDCGDALAHLIHETLRLQAYSSPAQLQAVLVVEIANVDGNLRLALWDLHLDWPLTIAVIPSLEVEAITFGHRRPLGADDSLLKVRLLQLIVELDASDVVVVKDVSKDGGSLLCRHGEGLVEGVSVRLNLGLDHTHDPGSHIVEHGYEPGLALGTRWGHVHFDEPQLEVLIYNEVEAIQLERVLTILYNFSHLRKSRLYDVVNLWQEKVVPSDFTVLLRILPLEVFDEVVAAQHQLVVPLNTIVRDVTLSVLKLSQVEMGTADAQVGPFENEGSQGVK